MACLFHKWDGCKCRKCNAVKPLEDSSHNYVYVDDCMKKCTVCGATCKNESTHNGGKGYKGLKCPYCGDHRIFDSFNLFVGAGVRGPAVFLRIINSLEGLKKFMQTEEIAFTDSIIQKLTLHLKDLEKTNDFTKWSKLSFTIEELVAMCVVLDTAQYNFLNSQGLVTLYNLRYGSNNSIKTGIDKQWNDMASVLNAIYKFVLSDETGIGYSDLPTAAGDYMKRIAILEKVEYFDVASNSTPSIKLPVNIREMIGDAKKTCE